MVYNIVEYGAVADGKTLATEAIQSAIDDCCKNGGGRVLIPSGNFYTGSIFLKDNVELHLDHGALLTASENMDDYNADDAYPQNYGFAPEEWRAKHLIIAHECNNVAITGTGEINGSGDSFRAEPSIAPENTGYGWRFGTAHVKDKEIMRPGQLICFIESTNIFIEGVTVRNAPCWCFFIHGCEYVRINGIQVFNGKTALNTDGIDIDCSRFVTISNCNIETGDDALTFRCAAHRLRTPKICEHVTVTNCNFAVSASAVRIGVGTGTIRHIRVSNITVSRAGCGLHFMTSYGGSGEAHIEDVTFSNISMCNVAWPIKMEGSVGEIKNVVIDNVRAYSFAGVKIIPGALGVVSDVKLRDFDMFVTKEARTLEERHRLVRGEYMFYAMNAKGLVLDNLRVITDADALATWSGKFKTDNCDGLIVKN